MGTSNHINLCEIGLSTIPQYGTSEGVPKIVVAHIFHPFSWDFPLSIQTLQLSGVPPMTLRPDAQVSNLWIPGLREALLLQAAPRQEALRLKPWWGRNCAWLTIGIVTPERCGDSPN